MTKVRIKCISALYTWYYDFFCFGMFIKKYNETHFYFYWHNLQKLFNASFTVLYLYFKKYLKT